MSWPNRKSSNALPIRPSKAVVLLTAETRHDIGIYFATDGGDARTDT